MKAPEMNISEAKNKLEFEKILEKVRKNCYSDLGVSKIEEIEFITEKNVLESELQKVEELKDMINSFGHLPIDGLKDIRKSLNKLKIEGYFITPEEFLHILQFLRISRILKNTIREYTAESKESFVSIWAFVKNLFSDKILEHNIDITVDEAGMIRDTASAELNRIRKQIKQQSQRSRKAISSILKQLSEKEYSQEDIVTQREGRFVIPVKVENKRKVQGIIHGSSSSGATVFIEPAEIIELNNEITELRFEERREIEKILRELAMQLFSHLDSLKLNCEILAEIDFVQAKARYAIESISEKPLFDETKIELLNSYHPILLQTHKRNEIVPLNIKLGEEFNTLVISGPNAGGKTVALKTVGLLQLMFQYGFLIPAKPESRLKIFKNIFISIGDEQSLENDLSTFSSHLSSIKDIISNADNNSFVLIDEIASGTDPVLGSALSASILKDLTDKKVLSIVTTHNSRLKEFAFKTEGIENASLEFDNGSLSPNFNFITGIPGQSFTFEIARKFDFPESILSDAENYLDKDESRLEQLLKELNEMKQNYSVLKNKYDLENARLNGLVKLYESKVKELEKNEKVLKAKAKIEAESIIKNANKLIEKTIKEIREEKNTPKEIKENFKRSAEALLEPVEFNEDVVVNEEIQKGDTVRIKGTKSSGEVLSSDGENAVLNINGLSVKAKIQDLEKISKKEIKKEYKIDVDFQISDKPLNFSLDLRGKYSIEIKDALEDFLNEAKNNNLKEVSIIHGKGSGKLREEVRNQLKGNTLVRSFRTGNWNEGDTGVTVVEL